MWILPPLAAAIEVALIRLAGDGDVGVFVILVCWGRVGRCGVSWGRVGWGRVGRFGIGRCGVSGWFVLRLVAGSGSNGQDSGDNELFEKYSVNAMSVEEHVVFFCLFLTNFML
jgi:hypothetical protein